MSKAVINGVPLECRVNPSLQINGSKVWRPPVRINGGRAHGVTINGYEYPPASSGAVLYLPGLPGQGAKIWNRTSQGATNDGTLNLPTWTRLPSGLPVLSFDGTDDYVDVGSIEPAGTYTVKCWVKGTVSNAWQRIICKPYAAVWAAPYAEYMLGISSINTFRFDQALDADNSTALSSSVAWATNTWFHLVGVWNGTTLYIYVNTTVSSLASATHAYSGNDKATVIGRRWADGADEGFTGIIALEEILDGVAWTAAQVANNRNQESHLFGI